jgi:hypothetical protein
MPSKAPVRLFDRLFSEEKPEADKAVEFTEFVNPDSLAGDDCLL